MILPVLIGGVVGLAIYDWFPNGTRDSLAKSLEALFIEWDHWRPAHES